MTGMLASVNSVEEASLVLNANVDIIDLKQPALGALGALETGLVKKIVTEIDGRCPVSATVGDLPLQPEIVFNAVKAMADTGVDYIKIGFFPDGDRLGTVEKLSALTHAEPASGRFPAHTPSNLALIAVLFADAQPDLSIIASLKNAGFKGVMLDTMNKNNGSLTQVMAKTDIAQFVSLAKAHQLICGLAGSLRLEDIPELMPYQPDYLGFRGALCMQYNRTAQLNKHSVALIKQAIEHADTT
ncbi:MAG: (5-formylfuran-3-yl)methyl phosphate synthase [Methylobacter sp.]|nr:(5-formylfuran-3-yl)methyl phosphate synthase [Methylobacter sp.]